MEGYKRSDLINPYEEPSLSVREPFPVFGGALLLNHPEYGGATQLRFIELTDTILNPQALVEQLGSSEVIAYCSDWGSGIEGEAGVGEDTEYAVNHHLQTDGSLHIGSIPEGMSMVLQTLLVNYGGTDRKFVAAGKFDTQSDMEQFDLEREVAYRELNLAMANFEPITRQIELLDTFTQVSATYNNAVSLKAYEDICEAIEINPGVQVAAILDPSFQALPRFFKGDEAAEPTVMCKARMPWDKFSLNLQHYSKESPEQLVNRETVPDAQRFWLDQIVYLKQLGQDVPRHLLFNALVSKIHRDLVSSGPDATGAEYRMISDQDNEWRALSEGRLMHFEHAHWERIRKALRNNGSTSSSYQKSFRKFAGEWLSTPTYQGERFFQ